MTLAYIQSSTGKMSRLEKQLSKLTVSVLPDFYIDRLILAPSFQRLFREIERKAKAGGGNIRGLDQIEIKGGNATNLAFALSSLGVHTNLFCIGDKIAQALLADHPAKCRIALIEGKPGYTTALEFIYKGKKVNVMLSDVGDSSQFDGTGLSKSNRQTLAQSDCIALVNWSSNQKANQLAKKIFKAGDRRQLNFLDPADLTGAETRIKGLVSEIVAKGAVDVISLNENEVRIMGRALGVSRLPTTYRADDVKEAAASLQDALSITIDIHTPIGSASSTANGTSWASSFGRVGEIVTGAGDSWDAGDIIGHLAGFEDEDRLQFANACAQAHLERKKESLISLSIVLKILKKNNIKAWT